MSSTVSVVLSCAGIGSRLGLGQTKALITIHERPLIAWQLEMFRDVEDVRIVLGYQSNDVITEVRKYRDDIIFVYNHNYFETKTGASFYLGAKDANAYVMEYDGDLLVHPEDMSMLLQTQGEYIAYSSIASDEAVFVQTNAVGDVLKFSRDYGDFEWTGPVCIQKEKIHYTSNNVYNQLEEHLPMRGIHIRACDIDTYEDYERAKLFIDGWNI